jgi:photosystem II stability/assembly factor-like uncharacterized protein
MFLDVALSSEHPLAGLALTSAGVASFDLGGADPVWVSVEPPRTTRAPSSRLVQDGDRVWLLGAGGPWASDDMGRTWVQPLAVFPSQPVAVELIDSRRGVVVTASSQVFFTDNGGRDWAGEQSGTHTRLTALHRGPDGTVWATGEGGAILRRQSDAE